MLLTPTQLEEIFDRIRVSCKVHGASLVTLCNAKDCKEETALNQV